MAKQPQPANVPNETNEATPVRAAAPTTPPIAPPVEATVKVEEGSADAAAGNVIASAKRVSKDVFGNKVEEL